MVHLRYLMITLHSMILKLKWIFLPVSLFQYENIILLLSFSGIIIQSNWKPTSLRQAKYAFGKRSFNI